MKTRNYIQYALTNRSKLEERRYYGDYGACDALIDINNALRATPLTEPQREVISYLYDEHMTSAEIAEMKDVDESSISHLNRRAITNIAIAYMQGSTRL